MDKVLIISGRKIFYRVTGRGNPVMLVHGFGETGNVWNEQTVFLESKVQLIIPDLPGSGQSEMIDDMSIEGMAEVLKRILDHESISNFILVGHSMGGYITLAFVERYPDSLLAFGLCHSTAYPDSDEKKVARLKGIEFIKQHGSLEFIKTTTPNLFSPMTKEGNPALIEKFIESLPGFSPDALIAYYEAMMKRPDRVAVLKSFEKPILFVMGEYDIAAPIQDVLKQCHLPQKAYIHILHQSGHMGMLEEKDKSNRSLQEFLSDVSPR